MFNLDIIITGIVVIIIEFIIILAFICILNCFNKKPVKTSENALIGGAKASPKASSDNVKTPINAPRYYFCGDTVFCFKDESDQRICDELMKILKNNNLSSINKSDYELLKYDVINVYTKINEANLKQIREDIKNTSVVQSLIIVENNFDNFKFIRSIKDCSEKVIYIMVNTEKQKYVYDYDITFGHKNYIIETNIEDLDLVLYEHAMIFLHNVYLNSRGFGLKLVKERTINDALFAYYTRTFCIGCNNWAKKKVKQSKFKSIKLSDLTILGQGYMNVVFSCDKYDSDRIIRISVYRVPNRTHPDIDEERIELLINHQHKSDHPFVKIYDYEIDKDDYLWIEVDRCYPIEEFTYFKGYTNYDLKKLEVLIRKVYNFLNVENKRLINGIAEKEWNWVDFNRGNIMKNSKGEYVIADLSLSPKFPFLKIANSIRNVFPTIADLDAKIQDVMYTRDVGYNERMMILCWLVFNSKNYREHKINFNDEHIHAKFIYAYYYYRYMLEQKYNERLEKAIKEGKSMEECRKIKNGFDELNEEHLKMLMDNVDVFTL